MPLTNDFLASHTVVKSNPQLVIKDVAKNTHISKFVFLLSRAQVLGSSKFLCLPPIIPPLLLRRSENSILTLIIMLRVKIDVSIHIQPRNGVKIFKKLVLGMRIFTRKLTRPPFRAKKNIHKYKVYCIQKNRLGNTISTKQSVN